jgi:hypothetical protein
MSDVQAFADNHRLKTRIDGDGTKIIPGRDGQIYEYDADVLAVMYRPKGDAWKPKTWGNARRACLALGFTLLQDGDSEGCLSFDPTNKAQAKLALKVAHIKTRRIPSPAALEHLTRMNKTRAQKASSAAGQPELHLVTP